MGDHLRARRLDLGLTQRQVGERIGADEATINNWEKGNTSPSLRFIASILRFVGYDPRPKARTFGEELRLRREALGLSQTEVARRLGLDPGTLSQLERGQTCPTRRVKERLARFFTDQEGRSYGQRPRTAP